MPLFRCYCLAAGDRITWGFDVEADTLKAAIEAACRQCQGRQQGASSHIEIWQGKKRLYASKTKK